MLNIIVLNQKKQNKKTIVIEKRGFDSMEFLEEFLQEENIKILKAFFEKKDIDKANEHNREEVRNAYIKEGLLELFEQTEQTIQDSYKELVRQFNENNMFLYNNSNTKRKVVR